MSVHWQRIWVYNEISKVMLNKDGKLQLYNGNVKNNFYYGDKIQFHPSYKEDESDISSSADIFVENYIKMLQRSSRKVSFKLSDRFYFWNESKVFRKYSDARIIADLFRINSIITVILQHRTAKTASPQKIQDQKELSGSLCKVLWWLILKEL